MIAGGMVCAGRRYGAPPVAEQLIAMTAHAAAAEAARLYAALVRGDAAPDPLEVQYAEADGEAWELARAERRCRRCLVLLAERSAASGATICGPCVSAPDAELARPTARPRPRAPRPPNA